MELEVNELAREPASRRMTRRSPSCLIFFLSLHSGGSLISFRASVFAGMTVGGTIVSTCLWNRPIYGLFSGMIHTVVAIGIKELFGKKVSIIYIAGLVIYTVGIVGREALKYQKNTSEPAKIQPKFWSNDDRMQIYRETIQLIDQGYFDLQNNKVVLQPGSVLYQRSECVNNKTIVADIYSKDLETRIVVVNQDCLEAAQEQVENHHKVVVVNFASHDNPGGNCDRGTDGQEEDLCYRSELAGFMQDQMLGVSTDRKQFYPLEGHSECDDHLIHTPDVLVFRASRANLYTFLDKPFRVGVLTSAAPVNPTLRGREIVDYANEEDKERVKVLIITQLYAAYVKGYDTVILGAFGCGSYQNPPQAVAKLYKEVINSFFKKTFKQIIFAILDDSSSHGKHNPTGNFNPFEECFKHD